MGILKIRYNNLTLLRKMPNLEQILCKVLKYVQELFNFSLRFSGKNETRIVHRSENFIIVNKAYDCKINSNTKDDETTVQTFLKREFPELALSHLYHEFYFVHRLDYSTSGVMCIPLYKKSCQLAAKAIANKWSRKYYLALIRGHPSLNLFHLNYPIGQDFGVEEIEKMKVVTGGMSKSAETFAVVIEFGLFDDYPAAKVLIRPITGRRHQIRVHFSHIGHTIIGDYTYSNRKDVTPFRMFLHSYRLILPNDIECLDVVTRDPFCDKVVSSWNPILKLSSIEESFGKLDAFVDDSTGS